MVDAETAGGVLSCTLIEHDAVPLLPAPSVALRVKLDVCMVVGVPLTSPLDSDKPAGRLPLDIE